MCISIFMRAPAVSHLNFNLVHQKNYCAKQLEYSCVWMTLPTTSFHWNTGVEIGMRFSPKSREVWELEGLRMECWTCQDHFVFLSSELLHFLGILIWTYFQDFGANFTSKLQLKHAETDKLVFIPGCYCASVISQRALSMVALSPTFIQRLP